MMLSRKEKYDKLRHVLFEPYDNDPGGTFPIATTDAPFNLADYAMESANQPVEMFKNLIKSAPDDIFLDLGCGYRENTYDNCLYLEVYPSRSADLIVDSNCIYPIRSESLSGIGCFAVLEHTRKPWIFVQEIWRMLKPGGQIFIDWPFLQPVHGYPSHFFNATKEGLTSIFEDVGFQTSMAFTGAHQTAAYTVQWVLARWAHNIRENDELLHEFSRMTFGEAISMSQQDPRWWRFLNAMTPDAFSELACGNMLVAKKEPGRGVKP